MRKLGKCQVSGVNLAFWYGIFLCLYEIKFLRELVPVVHPVLIAWSVVLVVSGRTWKDLPGLPLLAAFSASAGITALLSWRVGGWHNAKAWVMTVLPLWTFYPVCVGGSWEDRLRRLVKGLLGAAVVVFFASLSGLALYFARFGGPVRLLGMEEWVGIRRYDPKCPDSGILLYGIYTDTNHAAAYSLIFAAYSVLLYHACKNGLLGGRTRGYKWFALGNLAVQLCYFPLANSRGGWLALCLGILVGILVWCHAKKRRDGLLLALGSVAAVVLGLLILRTCLSRLSLAAGGPISPLQGRAMPMAADSFDKTGASLDGGRFAIWREALALFFRHPLFGTGPGNNASFAEVYFGGGILAGGKAIHNSFLDLLVDYGLVGSLILGLFWLWWLWSLRQEKREARSGAIALGTISGIFCVAGLLSCVFIGTTAMYFLLLMFAGFLVGPMGKEDMPLRSFLSVIRRTLVRAFMLLCRFVPVRRDRVVTVSYYGGGYGDNPKAILERLIRMRPGLDLLWAGNPGTEKTLPPQVKFVRFRSLGYYYALATARVWVDNSRKGAEVLKRRGQYYIQTWHGGVPLKRIEKDAQEHLSPGYLRDARHDAAMTDLMLSGSGFFTRLCRESFWYEGEILECGTPRLDALFRPGNTEVSLPEGKRFALYAPTFRSHGGTDCYCLDTAGVLAVLKRKTGEDWCLLLRFHPNMAGQALPIPLEEGVLDVTGWPDLYTLLSRVDLVISDYSSLIFEAGMLNKPVLLFAADLEVYARERDFYFFLSLLPFPLARDNRELLGNLESFDEEAYHRSLEQFQKTLDYRESGRASETVAGRILKVMDHGG